MRRIINVILTGLGFLFAGLGLIGTAVPVLPTVPFLIAAAFCFAKGSEKFHKRFSETKVYKENLQSFAEHRSMTKKQKIRALSLMTVMILISAFFVPLWQVKAGLIAIIIFNYLFFHFGIKTISEEEAERIKAEGEAAMNENEALQNKGAETMQDENADRYNKDNAEASENLQEKSRTPVIEIRNLVKSYGKLRALDGLNLTVEEGEIFGFLGPNGSGKTTALNCLLSLLKYDSGSVKIFGREMKPCCYDIKRDIGVVPQNVAVFKDFTVRENIDYFCGLYVKDRKKRKELVDEAIKFAGLEDYQKFRPKKLSGGLLRRLNLVCGIAHKPKLIILDEPTVAVDPQSRNKILEGIKELNRQGSTVIYTTHYMEEVEQICTKVVIMDRGKILAEGTIDELKKQTSLGDVFANLPTLNEVFLEITGKELRD